MKVNWLTVFVYSMFFVGYLLHMMLQIDAAVRAKNNSAVSRITVIESNVTVLLSRLFISTIVFWFLRAHPEFLSNLLGYMGITLGPGIGGTLNAQSWGVAGMFGFTADTLLAFIPFLKNYVPQLNEVSVSETVTVKIPPPPKP